MYLGRNGTHLPVCTGSGPFGQRGTRYGDTLRGHAPPSQPRAMPAVSDGVGPSATNSRGSGAVVDHEIVALGPSARGLFVISRIYDGGACPPVASRCAAAAPS